MSFNDFALFMASYPIWARIVLLGCVVVFLVVAVFARNPSSPGSTPSPTASESRPGPAIVSPGNQNINILGDGNTVNLQHPQESTTTEKVGTSTTPREESIVNSSYPILIAPPSHDRVKVKALVPEGATSINLWNGIGGNDGKVPVIYKIVHMLNVTNNTSKTIRGLQLRLFSITGQLIDLPVYGRKETKIDLNPGDPPAQFEIAYQFSLRSKHRPEINGEFISAPTLKAVYYHLKEGSPMHGKIGPFGTLDMGRGYIQLADATPVDKLGTVEGMLLPSRLQFSANDTPSLYLELTVSRSKETGFKIEAIPLKAKPDWARQ